MRFLHPWAWSALVVVVGALWLLRRQWAQQLGLDRAATVARALALVALVVALSGPQVSVLAPLHYTYFVVDRSASAQLAGDERVALDALLAFNQHNERERYGLIAFGREAYVDQPLSNTFPERIQTDVDPSGSDVAGALRLALETLPLVGKGNADIVLLSDGRFGAPELDGVLARARRAGVRVWSVPLGQTTYPDVRVDALELPQEVSPQQPFEAVIQVHAGQPTSASVLVYRNDELIHNEALALQAGNNTVRFGDALEGAGQYRYRVRLKAERDALLQNNEASDLVTVSGASALLLLERAPNAGAGLARLLDAAGFASDRRALGTRALGLGELSAYKAVVLDNVGLDALDDASVSALKAYVGKLGGGLWVIQGQAALAGVSTSPLEDLLPVRFEGPQREQLPGAALVFVLDRSSSMSQTASPGSGLSKLDVLKTAAAASVEVLRPEDWVGIVAFESAYKWIVPLQPLQDKQLVYDALKRMSAGGGTDLLPPLQQAFEQLKSLPARIKHILVYSDGKTVREDRDFDGLFDQIRRSEVTVSSVGLGLQPDEDMLGRLADAGQGKMFLVRDVTELPKVSVRETRRIVQRRWVLGKFETKAGPFAALRLSGLNLDTLPRVGGYVRTFAKPLGQMALNVEGAPLLGFWQYGLGQVAVLNSDLEGLWTAGWVRWPHLSALVAEVVSQLYANPSSNAGLVLRSERQAGALTLELDALDGARWVDKLEVEGTVLPEAQVGSAAEDVPEAGKKVRFTQVAPGRYLARLDHALQGLNVLRLEARQGGALSAQQTFVVSVPYAPEYQSLGVDKGALKALAERTGGALLEDERADFGPLGQGGALRYRDLWPWALGVTLLFFLGDLLLRKVPLEALLRS